MTRYQAFTIKRYIEQFLMFPFVLLGKIIAIFYPKWDYDIYFFIPTYALGGAEFVNIKILDVLESKKVLVIFTKKSYERTAFQYFQKDNITTIDISRFADNKLIYWANFICRGFFANQIRKNQRACQVFIGQCNFGYKLTPHLPKKIEVLELIHFFTNIFSNVWMPFVSFLDKRLCVSQVEIDKITHFYKANGIAEDYNDRIKLLKLYVDIPEDIKSQKDAAGPLKVYYAGRGTSQKRLWLSFEIARKIKQLNLPIEFHYVGSFEDELPNDFYEFAKYYPPLTLGRDVYYFIKDKDILLLTSEAEGLPIVFLEAMHFGIVPMVTPVGEMKNIVEHLKDGYLLENNSENEVVQSAIQYLTEIANNKSLLESKSLAINKKFSENYSKSQFENTIKQFFNLTD
ncbi:MAG TPA: glycosyltransferase [Edaphocola sp.]|nr:glycosyltransferase [Edaphocola sp.]